MLSLWFHVAFSCDNLVGAELSNFTTCEPWEASEPSLVYCIEPGGDWRGTHGHMVEVDEGRNSIDGDTIGFIG